MVEAMGLNVTVSRSLSVASPPSEFHENIPIGLKLLSEDAQTDGHSIEFISLPFIP
jgi:hypothetical protein